MSEVKPAEFTSEPDGSWTVYAVIADGELLWLDEPITVRPPGPSPYEVAPGAVTLRVS